MATPPKSNPKGGSKSAKARKPASAKSDKPKAGKAPPTSERADARRRRTLAAADLRSRAGKNMVFGAVMAIVGAVLTMWSNRGVGNIGLSVTQIIYWALIGGGALELAVGVFQLFQAREVLEGRSPIPKSILESNAQVAGLAGKIDVGGDVEVKLTPARGPHLVWGLVGGGLGLVSALLLGGAGTVIGILFLLWGGYHLVRLALTLARPAQAISVGKSELELPRSLYGTDRTKIGSSEIKHTYFLRHSAPWPHSRPVLVVDLGHEALLYPRDWFASDRDQELVAAALRDRIEGA